MTKSPAAGGVAVATGSEVDGGRAVQRIVRILGGIGRGAGRRGDGRDGGAVVAGALEPAGEVVGVGDRRAGRHGLGNRPVERVVAEGDGVAGPCLAAEHVVEGVVGEGLGAAAGTRTW